MKQDIYGPNPEYFKLETAYNSLRLERRQERLELRDQRGRLQSRIDLGAPHRLTMKNLQFLVAVLLFVPPPGRILMLGTAAGSLVHFFRHHYPAQIVAVDIDGELVSRLQELGVLPAADDRLAYRTEDALHYVDHRGEQYDLILFDIFDGGRSPVWIRERDNLRRLHRLLSPRGAIAFNLLIDSDSEFSRFYRNLQAVCAQQTLSTPVEDLENTVVFGFRGQLPERGIDWYLQRTLDLSRDHGIDYLQILSRIYTGNPQGTI